MTITTTQKIIKIGSSKGVTLPAKDIKRLGGDVGDEIKITIEMVKPRDTLQSEYNAFKKQYGDTLKNLSNR